MSYADYNFQYLKKVPKIEICKPDRTTVGIAKEAYDITLALKFSAINELQFSIPAIVERNFKIGQSDLVSKIKERYLVRLTYEDKSIEYFSILKINKAKYFPLIYIYIFRPET